MKIQSAMFPLKHCLLPDCSQFLVEIESELQVELTIFSVEIFFCFVTSINSPRPQEIEKEKKEPEQIFYLEILFNIVF
jgi:hypothetical protein